jgi:hypothetical protein
MTDEPTIAVKDSILQSTKKLLGLPDDYDAFDLDITTHINSAFSTLFQAGVGPVEGFVITGPAETWSQFIGDKMGINDVKSYIYLRVQMLFDRPTSSFGLTAVEKQIDELIWRLNVAADFTVVPIEPPETP